MSIPVLFLCLCLTAPAGEGTMSVITRERSILKTNRPVLMPVSGGALRGKGVRWSTLGSGGQRLRLREAKIRFGGLAEASFLIPFDRSFQFQDFYDLKYAVRATTMWYFFCSFSYAMCSKCRLYLYWFIYFENYYWTFMHNESTQRVHTPPRPRLMQCHTVVSDRMSYKLPRLATPIQCESQYIWNVVPICQW